MGVVGIGYRKTSCHVRTSCTLTHHGPIPAPVQRPRTPACSSRHIHACASALGRAGRTVPKLGRARAGPQLLSAHDFNLSLMKSPFGLSSRVWGRQFRRSTRPRKWHRKDSCAYARPVTAAAQRVCVPGALGSVRAGRKRSRQSRVKRGCSGRETDVLVMETADVRYGEHLSGGRWLYGSTLRRILVQ